MRRLTPLGAVVLCAFAVGVWTGTRGGAVAQLAAGATPVVAAADEPADAPAQKTLTEKVEPLKLVHGPALLAGKLHAPIAAEAAIVVDAGTGQVLWAKHPHERRPIASTTKIMTALLALKQLKWHQVITVDRAVTRVPLVREGLRTGEQVQAWKLFYAMLLYSGNDDALQIAIAAGGSKRAFLREMNLEARRLGMRDTHYTSPSGVVDEGNYSSVWDLAAVTRMALRNPTFRKIVRTKIVHVKWAPPTYAKTYVNNNSLLGMYEGANGVKTGFTHKAGWCLVSSATRHGRTLIAVVLHSGDMYDDSKKLLDLGFRNG
ncbi:MAG TPA: D-alanyl-D-alanine carboxypeptidase family protein [Gaiellaceae bacterium]|nr:D-alanyl-D-alanine carboxypeptidase family protein [Gaiellaceae bacterium]